MTRRWDSSQPQGPKAVLKLVPIIVIIIIIVIFILIIVITIIVIIIIVIIIIVIIVMVDGSSSSRISCAPPTSPETPYAVIYQRQLIFPFTVGCGLDAAT